MSQTPQQIEADIERQREALAQTVDQLTGKLDVKGRAGAKAGEVKEQASVKAAELKDRATTTDGKPRPELIGAAVGALVGVVLLAWWQRTRHAG